MIEHFITEKITYDGTQLSSLWAFRNFGLQGDSVVAFRGPCRVNLTEMVDLEDIRKNAPIYSTDMLHFIVEHFEMDLEKTIFRQRLFIAIIKDVIKEFAGIDLKRSGDDLFYDKNKLSVSIATLSPVSTMIHTGLNISSKDVPVAAIGLADLGVEENQLTQLGEAICGLYARESRQIKMARCKVRGVK